MIHAFGSPFVDVSNDLEINDPSSSFGPSRSPLLYLSPSGTALVIPPEATCHPRECQDHTSMHRRPPSSTMMVAVLVAACAAGEQVNCSDRRAPIWLQFVHRRRGDSRSSACTIILSLLMAGQREEFYSIKGCYGATLPYRYAHPDTVVVDQQLLHRNF